jgi:hypothetical protein
MTQEANQLDADTIAKLKEAIACYGQAIEAVIEADRRVDECRKIVREKGAIREEQREKVESILKENNLSWKYIYDEASGELFILKMDGLNRRDCTVIPRETDVIASCMREVELDGLSDALTQIRGWLVHHQIPQGVKRVRITVDALGDETDYPDTEDYVDTTKRAEAEAVAPYFDECKMRGGEIDEPHQEEHEEKEETIADKLAKLAEKTCPHYDAGKCVCSNKSSTTEDSKAEQLLAAQIELVRVVDYPEVGWQARYCEAIKKIAKYHNVQETELARAFMKHTGPTFLRGIPKPIRLTPIDESRGEDRE